MSPPQNKTRTLDMDIVHGKINLQCGTKVQWSPTFPEIIPPPLQPYVGIGLEEHWNHFQSHQLEFLLDKFHEETSFTLQFHRLTSLFSILAFLANVVVAITHRHGHWRELYPVICMVVVFAVLLITQYQTVKLFRQTLEKLTKRMENALKKMLYKGTERDRKEGTNGIKSVELLLKNGVIGNGTTRTISYTVRIGMGNPLLDNAEIRSEGIV